MFDKIFLISPCVRPFFCSVPSVGDGRQNDVWHPAAIKREQKKKQSRHRRENMDGGSRRSRD